jgi:hypothetical protein
VAVLNFRNRNCREGVWIFDEGEHEGESRGIRQGLDGTDGSASGAENLFMIFAKP